MGKDVMLTTSSPGWMNGDLGTKVGVGSVRVSPVKFGPILAGKTIEILGEEFGHVT